GLAVGVFAAFLWHLWELRKEAHAQAKPEAAQVAPAATPKPADAPANSPASPANGKGEEPRFDFYTLLPNQEVIPGKKPAATPPAAATKPAPGSYTLQAGSFKSEAEADKRRASILMLGLPVKVQKVPVKPGETWFRVVVGPVEGKNAAQEARNTLRSSGIDTMVIKQD
ncbi:MAG TPA: SPOR domain-containing protein, partial [Moraxellaceae bacterium]